jgi:tRNA (cmo5U34)-methyltransferase
MSIEQYSHDRARNYDRNSGVDKGNRGQHLLYLRHLLVFLRSLQPRSFIELGCGTGFFTSAFFNVFRGISGIAIDGSNEMLNEARKKFSGKDMDVLFKQSLFEDLQWTKDMQGHDIVFSCLAIHHLSDTEKWRLFKNIFDSLSHKGVFILFDIFKSRHAKTSEMMEYLACLDIQEKLRDQLGIDNDIDIEELRIEKLISEDRRIKTVEGDKEAFLDEQLAKIKESGFVEAVVFFQENRFVGIVAFKSFSQI